MNSKRSAVPRARGVLLVAVLSVLPGALTPASAQSGEPTSIGETVSVIVTMDPAAAGLGPNSTSTDRIGAIGDQVLDTLDADQVGEVTRYSMVAAMAVEVDESQLETLESTPGVLDVSPNRDLRPLLGASTSQVGAPAAWASGLTGAGQYLAVIDTGMQTTHPAFAGKTIREACFAPTTCPGGKGGGVGKAIPCTDWYLPNGNQCHHGTAVAAIAVGNGGGLTGVAPGANLLAVNVFEDDGFGNILSNDAAILDALNWVLEQRTNQHLPIAAVNLSLGAVSPGCTSPLAIPTVIDELAAAGVAIVAASGNNGSIGSLTYPACLANVVSVGSIDASGNASSFSNISAGLTLHAPGDDITTASPTSSTMTGDGTSFSAPHVAGAFAVLRQQRPSATVSSLTKLLDRTGDFVYDPRTGTTSRAGAIRLDLAIQPGYQSGSQPMPLGTIGSFDAATEGVGGVRLQGFALDPDTIHPAAIWVDVDDGAVTELLSAETIRPDIATAYGYGPNHGFDVTLPAGSGQHKICVWVLDGELIDNPFLGCKFVTVAGRTVGSFDGATATFGGMAVSGWALDQDTSNPIDVHMYVDGAFGGALRADAARADVSSAYGTSSGHGFSGVIPASGGAHNICAYAIAVGNGVGNNLALGCRSVVVPSGSPFGSLDVAKAVSGGIEVGGWAIDPDTAASLEVHVYVDGVVAGGAGANVNRPDLAAVFPAYGPFHGFSRVVSAGGGAHEVCAYAINQGGGTNVSLGCRSVVVPSGSPFGSLDVAKAVSGGIEVGGWAIDPDTAASLEVHVYVDGVVAGGAGANVNRPDLAAVFPAYGPFHGFSRAFSAGGGAHQVCAFAINVGGGSNASLGCRDVVVPDGSPFGSLDIARNVAGGVEVGGWAIDPDVPTTALEVHIYVDGVVAGGAGANVNRPDIAAVFPASGPFHGYSRVVPAGGGAHTVCVYAINVAGGSNKALGCKTTG